MWVECPWTCRDGRGNEAPDTSLTHTPGTQVYGHRTAGGRGGATMCTCLEHCLDAFLGRPLRGGGYADRLTTCLGRMFAWRVPRVLPLY